MPELTLHEKSSIFGMIKKCGSRPKQAIGRYAPGCDFYPEHFPHFFPENRKGNWGRGI
jgi:hypothetical protein